MINIFRHICIAGYRRSWRNHSRLLCRRMGCNKYSNDTKAPQRIPFILTAKSGISTHSPFTKNLKIAHKIQQVTVPNAQPIGIAVLHQFSASSLTKRIICCLLAPIQRIIPKNFVRCATLLFIQLEIINTPAINIITKQAAANG